MTEQTKRLLDEQWTTKNVTTRRKSAETHSKMVDEQIKLNENDVTIGREPLSLQ
jgi:hypothetical protein